MKKTVQEYEKDNYNNSDTKNLNEILMKMKLRANRKLMIIK